MSIAATDAFLFTAIHGGSHSPASLILAAKLVAKPLIYLLPLHLSYLWLRGSNQQRQMALILFLALICGLAASYLIGFGFYRPRPFLAGLGEALMAHRPSPAFPSNHALIFSAYGSTLLFLRQFWLGIFIFATGMLVGLARIYLGVHYPGDILGGLVLGVVAAMASLFIWARWGDMIYRGIAALWERILRPLR